LRANSLAIGGIVPLGSHCCSVVIDDDVVAAVDEIFIVKNFVARKDSGLTFVVVTVEGADFSSMIAENFDGAAVDFVFDFTDFASCCLAVFDFLVEAGIIIELMAEEPTIRLSYL